MGDKTEVCFNCSAVSEAGYVPLRAAPSRKSGEWIASGNLQKSEIPQFTRDNHAHLLSRFYRRVLSRNHNPHTLTFL